ncbi:Protein vip1 [Coemansia sp. RSA 1813]|nr:Protein vip1 [Coemansia sp. RSA 1646]KAJ1769513.1 Protein vip1 [Coemansia sp. RSA 1843]KAJ2087473.1 Protein vip1 [Coemansia sp. RSA 986]KAJ2211709.1 Protein vip1 [Coemansia sp. RSA 487]KAJ2566652.1 Protein vip1 [Coemansia sp. RSA 1813]
MVTTNWQTAIPTEPDSRYIQVEHIPLSADENTVRNFFGFCGNIETLELKKEMDGTQRALIKFADTEAAKTSLFLTSAQINHESIRVSPLFPETHPPATPPSYSADHPGQETRQLPPHQQQPAASTSSSGRNPIVDANYEGKPALYVVHELLAAGYLVGEHVVSRASEFDSKYRVTGRTQEQARSLDRQYKFSNHLQSWDEKFNISKRAKDAYNKLQSHPVGQKVAFTVNEAYQSAMQLSQDARQIAERKRGQNEQLFGKIPLPSTRRSTSSSSGQQQPPYPPPGQQQQQQQPQYQQQQQPQYPPPGPAGDSSGPAPPGTDYTNMSAPRNAETEKSASSPSQQQSEEKKQ